MTEAGRAKLLDAVVLAVSISLVLAAAVLGL
jgi:hypothetical protein